MKKSNIMKKRILRYLKHISLTILILLIVGVVVLITIGGAVHYDDHPLMRNLDREGPYLFYENDSIINLNYIRGNKDDGFYVEQQHYPVHSPIAATCYFPLDSTSFDFSIRAEFKTPPSTYQDNSSILAISDIESGYKTFRDFLINNKVIDTQLNWTFGTGHLVLVGDFVDRGYSTTQVLWFIYKLEQDAEKHGGFVHYILGNHELKNMQGKYQAASPKYYSVSAILGKQPHELYAPNSFLGRWMSSKNTVERINGNLFAHGGLHPDLADADLNLAEINKINRNNYYKLYFPKRDKKIDQLILSTRTGICWYRGYFKEDLTQEQIDNTLRKFNAKSIVVGHTIQSKVNRQYDGKVIGIDVRHPKDYHKNWPNKKSEGLLIEGGKYFRVLNWGGKEEI
ncbi:MAG: hypothetical protein ACI8P3_001783 [Saprospiraceae bacterium]|jgi:hypothetical protein